MGLSVRKLAHVEGRVEKHPGSICTVIDRPSTDILDPCEKCYLAGVGRGLLWGQLSAVLYQLCDSALAAPVVNEATPSFPKFEE